MIKGIRYYSLLGGSGYGDAAITYMEGLLERGVPLRWSPLVSTRWGFAPWHLLPNDVRPSVDEIKETLEGREELTQCLENDIDYDTVFIHWVPERWPKLVEPDKVNIGYTVWDSDRLPSHWPKVLATVDYLCVPCEFNRDIFSFDEAPPVSVVPHALRVRPRRSPDRDMRLFRRQYGIAENMYVFYLIASWVPRKSIIETIDAFLHAFTGDDNVCLLIKTDEMGASSRTIHEMCTKHRSGYANPAKVELIIGKLAGDQISLIHEVGDCFYSLTHCEGWGLGAFDAAAAGNPVIITGWGGQLDFLPAEDSFHVEYALQPVQPEKGWESYQKDHLWAGADREHAIATLRKAYQCQQAAKEKGLRLQTFIKDRFSLSTVTTILLEAINEAHTR